MTRAKAAPTRRKVAVKTPAVRSHASTAQPAPIAKSPAVSKKATKFFVEFAKTGELVDVYQSDWTNKLLRSKRLTSSVKDRQALTASDRAALKNRFLILALDPYRKDTRRALLETWKSMDQFVFKDGHGHNPDFFIFNTYSGQIIAFGLGRRAESFLFTLDAKGKVAHVPAEQFAKQASPFKSTFINGDAAGIVQYLVDCFVEIGKGYSEFGALPLFPEIAKKILAGKKRNDLGLSKTELTEIFEIGTRSETQIDAAEAPFRAIFERCKQLSWELNPEDY